MISHVGEASREIGPCLLIGQKTGGPWIVADEQHLCGGMFTTRQDAIRFALAECEKRHQPLLVLPNGVDPERSDTKDAA